MERKAREETVETDRGQFGENQNQDSLNLNFWTKFSYVTGVDADGATLSCGVERCPRATTLTRTGEDGQIKKSAGYHATHRRGARRNPRYRFPAPLGRTQLVRPLGVEPRTSGLRVRCSAS